jgi:preprotein translocase subunit SecF
MASSFLIVMTILFIFFKGLNLGIDFKGGFNVEVRSDLSNQEYIFEDRYLKRGYC